MTKLCAVESSLAVVPRQRVMKAWAAVSAVSAGVAKEVGMFGGVTRERFPSIT